MAENFTILDFYPNLTASQVASIEHLKVQGQACYARHWTLPTPQDAGCPVEWDDFLCWPPSAANTTVYKACPGLETGDVYAKRFCNSTGKWQLVDYLECLHLYHTVNGSTDDSAQGEDEKWIAEVLRDIYFVGSIVSLVLLLLTLFIFCYFKSLQCCRISIHKNLVLSFLLRFTVLIVMIEPYISMREYSYRDVDWLCKTLTALSQYFMLANIMWMFVEGLFLHNRVAIAVFSTDAPFKLFYFIGWGLPGMITLSWTIVMIILQPIHCWREYSKVPYQWIVVGPLIAALFVNVIFLINIIRILITKLRATNTLETDQVRKAVRATAVLLPLLGTTNLLFFVQPSSSPEAVAAYRITNAVLQSLQGVFVSVIYCFLNGEVRGAIRKTWQRYQIRKLGGTRNRRRSSRTSSFFLSQTEAANPLQSIKCMSTV